MIEEKMMPANRSKDGLQIKMIDGLCTHVRLERRTIIPGKEQYPVVTHIVRCYQKEIFDKMEDLRNDPKTPIVWYFAGGFSSAEVVHSADYLTDKEREEITAYRDEVLKPKPIVPGSPEDLAAQVKKLKRQMKKVQ